MCGITGFVSNRRFEDFSRSLPDATASLAHRGPDDSGIFLDASAGVGLGHRRLSILDVSPSGHQPMGGDNGKVQIVYNGEVYNFAVLRKELELAGHCFVGHSDTEVVLKAYLEWGIACLNRFSGMFALGIWDGRSRELFLARDRMGIKPLYYYFFDESLIFASELKAILAFRGVLRQLNFDAVPLYLHYQYIPAPHTIYQHMFKLLPGHFLRVAGGDIHVAPWHPVMPECLQKAARDESDGVDRLQGLLTDAVRSQMVSDVPLGALLSGGIDSSLVAAVMQQESSEPVRTFCIGFRDAAYNEAPWARRIARYLGTCHTELYVTPEDALAVIPRIPDIYDEPFADASALPSFLVHQLARSHVKVALTGDGGDEQFCGYTRYWATQGMAGRFQRFPPVLRKGLYTTLSRIPADCVDRCYRQFYTMLPRALQTVNFPDKWQKLLVQMNAENFQELYRASICVWDRRRIHELTGRFPEACRFEQWFELTKGWPVISALLQVDQHTYLPDAMLVKVDRASMASGLEVRVPLLDDRLTAFAFCLPESLLYRNGQGKYILRKLLSRYLPDALFNRPKMGFAVPVSDWLRGKLRPMLLDYLSPDRLKQEGIFDHAAVSAAVFEHLSGRANHPHRLWALLMWELWRDTWL